MRGRKLNRRGGRRVGTTRLLELARFLWLNFIDANAAFVSMRKSKFILLQIFFVAPNKIGLCLYLYFASAIWAPPNEKGLYGGPGDPILWGAFAFPFLFIFSVINFFVLINTLVRAILYMRWSFFFVTFLVIGAWCVAYWYDASRQFDGSWLQNAPPLPGPGQ